jgi:hypothetical protein
MPATANYDFEFRLFDALAGGTQLGSTQQTLGVPVANGVFTVRLDFGGQFTGPARFLEISVRQAGGGAYTPLAPRQPVTSAPYSIRSLNAAIAADSAQLGGVAASEYVLTGDARLFDARDPLPGSGNYVQNSLSPQPSSNFNISGNGTAVGTLSGGVVNAGTQFNFGGSRILSGPGTNLFSGINAGINTTGANNAFFGRDAGQANTTGASNSFFGTNAGFANTTGIDNSFFGQAAGNDNTTGGSNSFFGRSAGGSNTTGAKTSFVRSVAGASKT